MHHFHPHPPHHHHQQQLHQQQQHHFTNWDPHKLYNSMSQYNTNPVGALQERYQSRGITPDYRMVQAQGASHCPTFTYQVFVEEYISMGKYIGIATF